MEKESVKKFDLEAAFKALDEIDIPAIEKGSGRSKANRVDLKERFSHKPATETLVEDYYDVSSNEDLEEAKEEREGEVAQAKLARIEKIVDLDAETADDLLPSYVGKVIIQCPQCMTLFYKNPEDIEHSEENPDVVNVNEVCQHCGNTSGYTLIGKVDSVGADEADKYEEVPTEENELDLDFDVEEPKEEEPKDETSEEDLDLDLNLEEIPEEEPEEKNESLNASEAAISEEESEHKSENLTLNEEATDESLNKSEEAPSENKSENNSENLTLNEKVDKDLDKKLEAHNEYIEYLKKMIEQEEEALKKTENEEVKAAIQRRLDAFNADLEAALPDAVKEKAPVEDVPEIATEETEETPTEEEVVEALSETTEVEESLNKSEEAISENESENKSEETTLNESLTEGAEAEIDSIIASWGDVSESLTEEPDLDKLLDSKEFKEPVSEEEIDNIKAEVKEEGLEECNKQPLTEEPEDSAKAIVDSWGSEEDTIKENIGDKITGAFEKGAKVLYGAQEEESENTENKTEVKEDIGEKVANAFDKGVKAFYGDPEKQEPKSEPEDVKEDLEETTEVKEDIGDKITGCFEKGAKALYGDPEKLADDKTENVIKEEAVSVEEEPVEEEPVADANAKANAQPDTEETPNVVFTDEEVKEIAEEAVEEVVEETEAKVEPEVVEEKVEEVVADAVEAKLEPEEEVKAEEEATAEEPEFNEDDIDELDECSLNKHIDEYLQEVYSNVKSYETTSCALKDGKLIVEGKISFNSGKEKLTVFEFLPAYGEGKLFFEGYNKDFSEDKAFTLNCSVNESKTLITESFGYKYKINETLVEGLK